MKLKKWLKQMDMANGLYVYIWLDSQLKCKEEEPIFEGSLNKIPWWLVDFDIMKKSDLPEYADGPIIYVDSFEKEEVHRPGFVIYLYDHD